MTKQANGPAPEVIIDQLLSQVAELSYKVAVLSAALGAQTDKQEAQDDKSK